MSHRQIADVNTKSLHKLSSMFQLLLYTVQTFCDNCKQTEIVKKKTKKKTLNDYMYYDSLFIWQKFSSIDDFEISWK